MMENPERLERLQMLSKPEVVDTSPGHNSIETRFQNRKLKLINIISGKKQEAYMTKQSITEQQINSHEIIKSLLNDCKSKVITHQINTISPNTKLYIAYSETKKTDQRYLRGKSDRKYSENNKIIQQIYASMASERPLKERIRSAAVKNQSSKSQKATKQDKNYLKKSDKMLAVSCLISYNFNSIKAKRNLIFRTSSQDPNLIKSLSQIKNKAKQKISRSQHILYKSRPEQVIYNTNFGEAVSENYPQLETESYLNYLHTDKQYSQKMYGEELKNLERIQKYMKSEQTTQEQSEFIICQIKLAVRPLIPEKSIKSRYKKHRRNLTKTIQQDQEGFETRKIPSKKTKIIVSYLQVQ